MTVDIASQDHIDRLVAGKRYGEAADLLRKIVEAQPRNVRMRERLSDVLTLAGQTRKAVKVLDGLVDDFVRAGLPARAIAVVKKMQRIDPGFRDLDARLAVLVKRQQDVQTDGTATAHRPRPGFADANKTTDKIPKVKRRKPQEKTQEPAHNYNEIILQNTVEERDALSEQEGPTSVSAIHGSALFKDFDTRSLQALISGLEHIQVQPGEIIVAEGQPGSSLYLIATGSVRVYVVNPAGEQKQIRVLRQGDFFGEISLLKGTRRTATITAATEVELLELDRDAVDRMAEQHPYVRQVIELFCTRRAGSAEELDVRAGR